MKDEVTKRKCEVQHAVHLLQTLVR